MVRISRLLSSSRKLLIFDAAARAGSFSAAAREFNLTQPSVSRGIAELEASLGIILFERSPGGLTLTDDGRELHAVVGDSLDRIENKVLDLQERNKVMRPSVTLSFSSSFVLHWMVPKLQDFQKAFPKVDLRFDLVAGLLRGVPDNTDLATRILPVEDTRFLRWDFAPEIIVPVCSPAYLEKFGPLDPASDGTGHTFLHLTDHDQQHWRALCGGLANRNAMKGVWLEFSDYAVVLQAALAGEGIALGWISVIARHLLKGTLVPVADRMTRTGKVHQLVRLKSQSPRPIVDDIRNWLVHEMSTDIAELSGFLSELSPDR
ncbi:LysR family transcriptional regulator [Hoeflea sp. BAL378]|uniref:LysR substrate-binding domain-containing protein n=1 Tax=Hoeflea sp. BAL378 TaxID=1547437 RepID=UPI0005137DE0|nr:LysR substrate-binding domain-containing protein [Hoeflea sp. BAL378]KGF69384.1 LysR family transcriptional regulator [Hoeflea sp. BAL378]